jgi:hypothetical protein
MAGYCGAWSAVRDEDGVYTAVPLRCRSWSCPFCAPRLKKRLVNALQGVEAHRFITLTCNPEHYPDPETAFRRLSLALGHLIKRIRRLHPNSQFEYFVVWEVTRKGWPHLHMAARGAPLPQRWLSRQWEELTGAAIVHIRRVEHPEQLASYLAKELAKSPTAPAGMKRFRCSRGFLQGQRLTTWLRPPGGPGWTVVPVSTSYQADLWLAAGHLVYALPGGIIMAVDRQKWWWLFEKHPAALRDWEHFLCVASLEAPWLSSQSDPSPDSSSCPAPDKPDSADDSSNEPSEKVTYFPRTSPSAPPTGSIGLPLPESGPDGPPGDDHGGEPATNSG